MTTASTTAVSMTAASATGTDATGADMTRAGMTTAEDLLAQVRDEAGFAQMAEQHRRELQVHCYRMLGSFDEAEDLVQETFLRAWRHRATFEARSTFRAWLYRIATSACLDALARRPRTPQPAPGPDGTSTTPMAEVTWLQPFPDRLLDTAAPAAAEPEAQVIARETIELVFLVALQHLPARQRAVLLLRDVLGWPAADTARALDLSVAAANSALQRARTALRSQLPRNRGEWSADAPAAAVEREVLRRFIDACERGDMDELGALMREDVIHTMPPESAWLQGRELLIETWQPVMVGATSWGEWRLLPVWTNRQPAAANYVRRPGSELFDALTLDVLRVEDGLVVEVTTFGAESFTGFGLPETLPA